MVSFTLSQIPESKFIKERYWKFILNFEKTDLFGTRICEYRRRKRTIKLYYPKPENLLKETTDLCQHCEVGYLVWHRVIFKDQTDHIQATCNTCHRFHAFIEKDSE